MNIPQNSSLLNYIQIPLKPRQEELTDLEISSGMLAGYQTVNNIIDSDLLDILRSLLDQHEQVLLVGDSGDVLSELLGSHLLASLHQHDHIGHGVVVPGEQLVRLEEPA